MARTVTCLRYFLLAYVILLGISGIVVSVGSGIFIYQLKQYRPLTPDDVCGSSITLLIMGLVTCLLGWGGWHIVDSTHRVQVICFAVVLGTVAFVEAGTGIWAVIKHEQIDPLRTSDHETAFALATTDEKSTWDRMQIRLGCCGIDGPADYRILDSVPWSCCDTSSVENPETVASGTCTTMYSRGCLHFVVNRTRSILLHVFLLALCSVLLQVCGVICACFFARAIKEGAARRRRDILSLSGMRNSRNASPMRNASSTGVDSQLMVKPRVPPRRKT